MITLCESAGGTLACPDDDVITIHHVMFGRETEAVCPSNRELVRFVCVRE